MGAVAPAVGHHPELWEDLCGWYRLAAGITDVRLRGMLGAGAEVFVRSGRLLLRFLTPIPSLARGFPLEPAAPDDPYVFRIDLTEEGLDPIGVVFGQGPDGSTTRLHLDVMPLTLEKQSRFSNPRGWAGALAGALGLRIAVRALTGHRDAESVSLR